MGAFTSPLGPLLGLVNGMQPDAAAPDEQDTVSAAPAQSPAIAAMLQRAEQARALSDALKSHKGIDPQIEQEGGLDLLKTMGGFTPPNPIKLIDDEYSQRAAKLRAEQDALLSKFQGLEQQAPALMQQNLGT